MNLPICGSCGAKLLWAQTPTGEIVQLDAEAVLPAMDLPTPAEAVRRLFVFTGDHEISPAMHDDDGPFFQPHSLSCKARKA